MAYMVKDVGFEKRGSFWFVSIFRQENSSLFYAFENVSKECKSITLTF